MLMYSKLKQSFSALGMVPRPKSINVNFELAIIFAKKALYPNYSIHGEREKEILRHRLLRNDFPPSVSTTQRVETIVTGTYKHIYRSTKRHELY